jgi:hypothetical protein
LVSIFYSINSIKNAHGLCPFGLCPLRAVSAPSPRGRCGKFVARQRADCHIQSDQVCATEQRQPEATCTGAPLLRPEVPWQSWLAVVHEVTTEQRLMQYAENTEAKNRKASSYFETLEYSSFLKQQRRVIFHRVNAENADHLCYRRPGKAVADRARKGAVADRARREIEEQKRVVG